MNKPATRTALAMFLAVGASTAAKAADDAPQCIPRTLHGRYVFSATAGPTFDIFVSPRGNQFWLIQTNPDNVFQVSATRTSPEPRDRDQ